jgi:cell division septation protein DedD
MPLFDKGKKSGHIKPLSEEEIQKKLYGSFQEGNARLLPEEEFRDQSLRESHKVHEEKVFSSRINAPAEEVKPQNIKVPEKKKIETFTPTPEPVRTLKPQAPLVKPFSSLDSETKKNTSIKNSKSSDDLPSFSPKKEKDLFSFTDDLEVLSDDDSEYEDDLISQLEENEESEDLGFSEDTSLFHIENPENDSAIKGFTTDYTIPSSTRAAEEILSEVRLTKNNVPNDKEALPSSVSFSYDSETDTTESVNDAARDEESPTLKTISSSFKIDFVEFLEKVKKISPFLIGGIILFIVFFFVIFNIWIRSSSKGVTVIEPSAVSVKPSSGTTREESSSTTVPRAVVVKPAVNAGLASSTDSTSDSVQAPSRPTPPAPIVKSFYTFQICVYGDKERTVELVERLKEQGQDAFFEEITTRSGRVLYNVCTGKFATSEDANVAFNRFKQTDFFKQFPDSFIKWNK